MTTSGRALLDDTPRRRPLRTLIVGCGHAARDLHLPVLARQAQPRVVGVVDPLLGRDRPDPTLPAHQYRSLAEATEFRPAETVVHVCAGPQQHARLIAEAARRGYRRFVVEKPLATSARQARQVLELVARQRLHVLVVANWLASSLTVRLRELLAAAERTPESVLMRQHKPRIGVTLNSATHSSAFDVEMPHLVALAVHLFGPDLAVVGAESADLRVGRVVQPGMASAVIELRTPAGTPLRLESSLVSPVLERSVTLRWPDGSELRGYFPVGAREFYSQLLRYDPTGQLVDREFLPDETMARFLGEAYAWFENRGPAPVSNAQLHRTVVELIERARAFADPAAGSGPAA